MRLSKRAVARTCVYLGEFTIAALLSTGLGLLLARAL